ncbi:MAG: hypothetical protein AAGF11_21885 [Myxococcota bacterium]
MASKSSPRLSRSFHSSQLVFGIPKEIAIRIERVSVADAIVVAMGLDDVDRSGLVLAKRLG